MQVGKQVLGSPCGQSGGAVGDVGLQDGPDAWPVRCDEPFVAWRSSAAIIRRPAAGWEASSAALSGRLSPNTRCRLARTSRAVVRCIASKLSPSVVLGPLGAGSRNWGQLARLLTSNGQVRGNSSGRAASSSLAHRNQRRLPSRGARYPVQTGDGFRQGGYREAGRGQVSYVQIQNQRHPSIM